MSYWRAKNGRSSTASTLKLANADPAKIINTYQA